MVRRDASLPPEGYAVRITPAGAVEVRAKDDAGAFYAQATLTQLAREHEGRLPVGEVEDWPELGVRGVMLDISRDKVPTMATLKDLIDRLAAMKINQLQLYSEHTFAYRDHEAVWRTASPLTSAEIRELDEFCRARFVELVPNQNCLGHWDRWLRHDRYRPLAIAPDGYDHHGRHRAPTTLDPAKPEAMTLVRSLLAELLPNFTSNRVHVGLDEPWELSHDRVDDYVAWVRSLRAAPELEGKEMLMWGDIVAGRPDVLAALPDGITLCEWGYDAGHIWDQRGTAYTAGGRTWWACPGTSSWITILGRWANMTANIAEAAAAAARHGAGGLLNTDWGDLGHLQYLPVSEPGFAWGAAMAWGREANADLDLPAALDAQVFADTAGVVGSVLRDLGDVYLSVSPQFPNLSTLVLHLYYPQLQLGRSFTEDLQPAELDAAIGALDDVVTRLSKAAIERDDANLVIDELRCGAALVRLLATDAKARLEADGWLASVPEPKRLRLADDLEPLIAEHRRLWLARNRPGGLDDSAAWLENLAHCYRTGETDLTWGGW
jgi:hypothetical protein